MVVAGTDPFAADFEGWPASDTTWSEVHYVPDLLQRQPHEAPLQNNLTKSLVQGLVQKIYI